MISVILSAAVALANPSGVYDVRAYGAKGDGITKDTVAVQAAIDAAGAAGGGEVVVPAGRYLCGTLYLKSNVDVNLALGATIEGSKDPSDYNRWDFCPQNSKSVAENASGGHLIVCLEQTNVVLRGAGMIDGSGRHFMTHGFDPSRVGKTGEESEQNVLTLMPDDGRVCLYRKEPAEFMELPQFCEAFAAFSESLMKWRDRLAGVSAEGGDAAHDGQPSGHAISDGFMQV